MGKREPGDIYLHAMLWDPQKSRGAHIKGDIHSLSELRCSTYTKKYDML